MEPIKLIQADITTLEVDAIVNAANKSLMGGGGVDGAIHRAAGPELTEACRLLKGCETGQSKITGAFRLPSKYVIHTVGPVWNNGTQQEEKLLTSCYRTALELAAEFQLENIAFPAISTGAYRFPFEKAGKIALETIRSFLEKPSSLKMVYLVCFDDHSFQQYERIMKQNEP